MVGIKAAQNEFFRIYIPWFVPRCRCVVHSKWALLIIGWSMWWTRILTDDGRLFIHQNFIILILEITMILHIWLLWTILAFKMNWTVLIRKACYVLHPKPVLCTVKFDLQDEYTPILFPAFVVISNVKIWH